MDMEGVYALKPGNETELSQPDRDERDSEKVDREEGESGRDGGERYHW
jgi:hypothetical protein